MDDKEELIEENRQGYTFPKGAMWLYIGSFVLAGLLQLAFDWGEVTGEGDVQTTLVIMLIAGLLGGMGLFVGTVIEYALILYPSRWIAKDREVYKYDIWAAIFYSGAIGVLLAFLIAQLNVSDNLFVSMTISAVGVGLFLYFYYSGIEKPQHVKRAVTIVQVGWFILGTGLSVAGDMLLSSMAL
ncbi:hypothetical protein ADIAL_0723 [Alkalibacterium sp. AK22]|uniref:hypothetical protein n=1 Tax=Alkalibacterium sp. AK22 TaxID=1229520 RepID=UPI00044EB4DB|nr:hypothetical protein [Alkalibacterium sp. AK22]EXJ23931.1 hypothetical protein ADIAL_0723 [Alkalibacterium sp. AK22]